MGNPEYICPKPDYIKAVQKALDLINGLKELKDKPFFKTLVENFHRKAAHVILQTDAFLEWDMEQVLSFVTDTSKMRFLPEIIIFKSLVRWAQNQALKEYPKLYPGNKYARDHIRDQVVDLFKKVRFPIMGMDDFITDVSKSRLLSDEHFLGLCNFIALPVYDRLKQRKEFTDEYPYPVKFTGEIDLEEIFPYVEPPE